MSINIYLLLWQLKCCLFSANLFKFARAIVSYGVTMANSSWLLYSYLVEEKSNKV